MKRCVSALDKGEIAVDEEKKELGVSAESEFSLEDILKEFGDE